MARSLLDAIIRHQLYLEGLKLGQRREFAGALGEVERIIQQQLSVMPANTIGGMTKAQLVVMLRGLKRQLWGVFNPEIAGFVKFLENYLAADRSLWIELFAAKTGTPIAKLALAPTATRMFAAAAAEPMGANGVLMIKFVEASRASAVVAVLNELGKARSQHWTREQTVNAIVGTRGAAKKDGVLHRIANQQAAVTNTVMQHLSASANHAVGKQAFAEYEWVSVLDDVTTQVCRGRDGKKFQYGKGPLPPAHVNCRSTVKPLGVNTGEVDYLDTFAKWAKATPETVLKDIFKDGEADVRNVKPLTLEQFKTKRNIILSEKD